MRYVLKSSASLAAMLVIGAATMAPARQADATAGCELHVWPSAGMSTVSHGVSDGFGYGYYNNTERYSEVTGDHDKREDQSRPATLATGEQVALLTSADLPTQLGLAGYHTVVHPEPLTSGTIRTTKGRYAPESSACYADLVLNDVVLQWDFANGHHLKSFYRYRLFGAGDEIRTSFGTWVQTKLTTLKKQKKQYYLAPDPAAAEKEMSASFLNNATLFAQAMINMTAKKK